MKYLPIIVLVGLAAIGGGYLLLSSSNDEPATDTGATEEAATLQGDLEQTEAERTRLESELAEAEARIEALESDAATTEMAAESTDVEAVAPAEDAVEEEPLSLNDIRARIQDNPAAKVQLKALSELVYADFLNAVEMDAETKAEVRRLLTESFSENMALNQYGLQSEEATWSDVRAWTLDERALLDEELRAQLSGDAYAAWTEYSADLDARQLDSTLRNQIRALASGLTPDNFELVMGVAVQEFRAEQIALEQSNELFTMEENVNYQLRAMDAMRAQLQGVLSEDQFAELQNFLTFGENALNAQLGQVQQ